MEAHCLSITSCSPNNSLIELSEDSISLHRNEHAPYVPILLSLLSYMV